MKRRHQRAGLAAVSVAGLLSSVLTPVVLTPAPAAAAPGAPGGVAGTGTAYTAGTALTMRRAPSTSAARVGAVAHGGRLWIICQVPGDLVSGAVRSTRMWNRLANNAYVSDAYVIRTGFAVPACSPGARPGAWMLPVGAGLVSAYRSAARPAHDGVDLGAARYTPIRAAAAGRVIRVVCNVSAGSCDQNGSPRLRGCGWYAEIRHPANIVTRYCHMARRPLVPVGRSVVKGQVIGYVGSSGSSSGPHLHFEVHTGVPATRANAVNPIPFLRARGVPV